MQSNDCLQESRDVSKSLHPDRTLNIVQQVGRCRGSISPVSHEGNCIHWQNPNCELEIQSLHHVLNDRWSHCSLSSRVVRESVSFLEALRSAKDYSLCIYLYFWKHSSVEGENEICCCTYNCENLAYFCSRNAVISWRSIYAYQNA